ncbi:MAG: 50S ribosomal protein L35 [Planctomycetota bacterium]|nr:50S ribosomal protein L35 [Planctomycetota bacterium]
MPKLKTRKSVAKRFKVTKTGKVLPYGSANTSHIMSKKGAKRRRRLRHPTPVVGKQAASMLRMSGK